MQLVVKRGIRPEEGRVLSYAEENAMDKRAREFEIELMGKEVAQGLSYSPERMQSAEKWLAHYKKQKAALGAQRFEGKDRIQAEIDIRKVEQNIAKKWGGRIPTYAELWIRPKEGGIHYANLVQMWIKLNADREFGEFVRQWKYLRRRMEPDDPHADNVLHLYDRKR